MISKPTILLAIAGLLGFLLISSAYGQTPLPDLKVEATDGGSVLHIRNGHSQPLTAFLIELVDYPGSSFSLWHDEFLMETTASGAEISIPITNMTVGAAPEYVKVRAAIYADGSTSGIPEKVAALVNRRRFVLETTGKLISRLEDAKTAGTANTALMESLQEWAKSFPQPTRRNRNSQEAINHSAARAILASVASDLEAQALDSVLNSLRQREQALKSSKPPLLD